MASQDLVREVFGGSDSELSDEEEVSKKTLPQAKQRDDYESSGADSGDDYVQEKHHPSVVGKARKIKRKRTLDADGQPRKRKRRTPVEPDLSELTPDQAARRRTDMQIDEILKSKKTARRKKKTNEEALDSFADHEVSRLREVMNAAAEEDINANNEKLPAVAKLKLLPEAMDTLRKVSLAQSMIDNNLLDAVRRWLEPLPDRSLPALNIQRELFGVIRKMEFIDSSVLKESGLGRIVLFYTKCNRVNSDLKRIANDLVMAWARPIIKRSASYRDRIVPVVQDGDAGHRGGENLNAILARARNNEKGRVRKNAVMIPQRELGSYTVAPKVNAGVLRNNESVNADIERRKKTAEWMRTLTRKINSTK
jgi:transcription factor SPN1